MSGKGVPLIVVTGGIASGKSMVAEMLSAQGAWVISADQLAREVMEPGTPAWSEIVQTFGHLVLSSNDEIDRWRLGTLIFANDRARNRLEEITHPRIWALLLERIKSAQEGLPLVAVEIPLYFESGRSIPQSEVWVVYVDKATQVKRLMIRDGLTEGEAEARLRAQLPLSAKRAWADQVIDNTGSKEDTLAQVKAALVRASGIS